MTHGEEESKVYVREALDEGKLVDNFAALIGNLLLCGLELLLGSVLLEGNLNKRGQHVILPDNHVSGDTCVELSHFVGLVL